MDKYTDGNSVFYHIGQGSSCIKAYYWINSRVFVLILLFGSPGRESQYIAIFAIPNGTVYSSTLRRL